VTDQRNRVTTDPGLGPIEREHASTLRSITAAEPIPEDEIPGSPVYYEPKPLHAVSEHKTLELETVKLAKDIDPRKLPTELKLRRPVLHIQPASDPNWPPPSSDPHAGWPQQPDIGWPPQHDSGWPPPETVLTTSQPPLAARRRSFVPLILLVLLSASLLVVLGARALPRLLVPAGAAQAAQPAALAVTLAPQKIEPAPTPPPLAAAEAAPVASAAAPPEDPSAEPVTSATTAASAMPAEASPSAMPARSAEASHHTPFRPVANSPALSVPPSAKPKRAIY